jgi:hypothetical protein
MEPAHYLILRCPDAAYELLLRALGVLRERYGIVLVACDADESVVRLALSVSEFTVTEEAEAPLRPL